MGSLRSTNAVLRLQRLCVRLRVRTPPFADSKLQGGGFKAAGKPLLTIQFRYVMGGACPTLPREHAPPSGLAVWRHIETDIRKNANWAENPSDKWEESVLRSEDGSEAVPESGSRRTIPTRITYELCLRRGACLLHE